MFSKKKKKENEQTSLLESLKKCFYINYNTLITFLLKLKRNLTRNATRCDNRDDLLHLSFTLKILIFSEAYI